MEEILNITEKSLTDNSITSYQYQEFSPHTGYNLNKQGEILITIFPSDEFCHPNGTYLLFEGSIRKPASTGTGTVPVASTDQVTFCNSGILYLFRCLQYQISGNNIETLYDPGVVALLKRLTKTTNDETGLLSLFEKDENAKLTDENKGFKIRHEYTTKNPDPHGGFSCIIYLKDILGFFEDYTRVLSGVRQQLRLIRGGDDDALVKDVTKNTEVFSVQLDRIGLFQPIVKVNDSHRFRLYQAIKSKEKIEICFNEHVLESLQVPKNHEFTWNLGVRTARPQYILFAFQADRRNDQKKNPAIFDDITIRNYYITINDVRYPEKDYALDFKKYHFAQPYNEFLNFYHNYYGTNEQISNLSVSPFDYQSVYPVFVIDVSKQTERLRDPCLNLTLRIFFTTAVTTDTTNISCLLINERKYYLQGDGKELALVK